VPSRTLILGPPKKSNGFEAHPSSIPHTIPFVNGLAKQKTGYVGLMGPSSFTRSRLNALRQTSADRRATTRPAALVTSTLRKSLKHSHSSSMSAGRGRLTSPVGEWTTCSTVIGVR
jgi:hypothetical protein